MSFCIKMKWNRINSFKVKIDSTVIIDTFFFKSKLFFLQLLIRRTFTVMNVWQEIQIMGCMRWSIMWRSKPDGSRFWVRWRSLGSEVGQQLNRDDGSIVADGFDSAGLCRRCCQRFRRFPNDVVLRSSAGQKMLTQQILKTRSDQKDFLSENVVLWTSGRTFSCFYTELWSSGLSS